MYIGSVAPHQREHNRERKKERKEREEGEGGKSDALTATYESRAERYYQRAQSFSRRRSARTQARLVPVCLYLRSTGIALPFDAGEYPPAHTIRYQPVALAAVTRAPPKRVRGHQSRLNIRALIRDTPGKKKSTHGIPVAQGRVTVFVNTVFCGAHGFFRIDLDRDFSKIIRTNRARGGGIIAAARMRGATPTSY